MASPVLITELAFPTHRAPITGLYNSSWYLGSILAAWVTYGTFRIDGTWSWRIPSLLQGVPSVLQLILVFLIVPESPRWLVKVGKDEQALATIAKYHCNGDTTDPLIQFEYQEIKEALRVEMEINRTSSYKALFSTPGNRRRMMAIIPYSFFSQWSGVSHTLYGGCVPISHSAERYPVVLPQPRPHRCWYHLGRLAQPHQRYASALERLHCLRWCPHR